MREGSEEGTGERRERRRREARRVSNRMKSNRIVSPSPPPSCLPDTHPGQLRSATTQISLGYQPHRSSRPFSTRSGGWLRPSSFPPFSAPTSSLFPNHYHHHPHQDALYRSRNLPNDLHRVWNGLLHLYLLGTRDRLGVRDGVLSGERWDWDGFWVGGS